ncbi:MAG: hypothetical protein WCN81_03635 [Actinomycetes bacterium]
MRRRYRSSRSAGASQPIEWDPILKGLLVFAAYTSSLLVAAWFKFRRKDILV